MDGKEYFFPAPITACFSTVYFLLMIPPSSYFFPSIFSADDPPTSSRPFSLLMIPPSSYFFPSIFSADDPAVLLLLPVHFFSFLHENPLHIVLCYRAQILGYLNCEGRRIPAEQARVLPGAPWQDTCLFVRRLASSPPVPRLGNVQKTFVKKNRSRDSIPSNAISFQSPPQGSCMSHWTRLSPKPSLLLTPTSPPPSVPPTSRLPPSLLLWSPNARGRPSSRIARAP